MITERVPIHIRPARIEDVDRLHALIHSAYRTPASWTSESEYVKNERITLSHLHSLITLAVDPVLVAIAESVDAETQTQTESKREREREKVVGCISAEAGHLHPDLQLGHESALLGLFAVDPLFQSQGIGSRLMYACMDECQRRWKTQTAVVWVLEPRQELIEWYKRLGFVWTGRYKDFVMPENALVQGLQFCVYEKPLK